MISVTYTVSCDFEDRKVFVALLIDFKNPRVVDLRMNESRRCKADITLDYPGRFYGLCAVQF